jgi:hypothetical protein
LPERLNDTTLVYVIQNESEPDGLAHDRQALEAVLGYPVGGEPWPDGALRPGTRVRVIRDPDWRGPWEAAEFAGVVDAVRSPRPVQHPSARPGELVYFVAFDEAQYDSAGGGPYRKAQIWDRYLEPL